MARLGSHARRTACVLLALVVAAGIATVAPWAGAAGATYYVSTSGSDSNPGTSSAPFRTIAKGASILNPGDTLYVKGGTYLQSSSLTISRSGTSTAPITISTAPGEPSPALISGDLNGNGTADATDTPANNRYGALVKLSGSYITFQNFEVAYSGGRSLQVGSNDIVRGNNVHHAWGTGMHISGAYNLVEGNSVWRGADSNYCGGVGGARACNGNWEGGLGFGQAVNAPAPPGAAHHNTIRGNKIFHNSGEGLIGMYSDYNVLEGNTIYDNWAANIDLDQTGYTTVKKNLIYYTADKSWWRDANLSKPSGNIMLSNEGITSSYPILHDATIIDNISIGGGTNLNFWSGTPTSDSRLINVLIADNTFVEAQGGTGISINAPINGNHQNTRITNNIVLQSSGSLTNIPSTTGITFDHNLWSRAPSSSVSNSTDVVANPLLADPNHTRNAGQVIADWYKLTSGSPAVGKAPSISAVTDDYFGTTRTNPTDMGAHQYRAAAAVPTATLTAIPTATAAPTSTPAPTKTLAPTVASTPPPAATAIPPTATPAPPKATATPVPPSSVTGGSSNSNNGKRLGQEKPKPTPPSSKPAAGTTSNGGQKSK